MSNRSERKLRLYLSAMLLSSADERRVFIDESCSGDAEMAAEVLAKVEECEAIESRELAEPTPWQSIDSASIDCDAAIGDAVKGFILSEHLGTGSYGDVFKASGPDSQDYAVKFLKKSHCLNPTSVNRFTNEQAALRSLDHPSFANIHANGISEKGQPFFVMDYVDGAQLSDYCNANALALNDRLRLFVQICDALQHAHDRGQIHRDLKPEHILINRSDSAETVHIIDFGIAKELARNSSLTQTGEPIGSVLYMSPEQIAGTRTIDHRSDIFSLGVILHELLTGENPFTGDKRSAITYLANVIHESPTRPSDAWQPAKEKSETAHRHFGSNELTLCRKLRGPVDRIALKALEKSPNGRYSSATEFAAAIEDHLAGKFFYHVQEAGFACLQALFQPGPTRRLAIGTLLAVTLAVEAFYFTQGSRWRMRAQLAAFSQQHQFLDDCKLVLTAETGSKIDIESAEIFIYEHGQTLLGKHFITMWPNQREHVVESVTSSNNWLTWEMPLSLNWDRGPNKVDGESGNRNSGFGPENIDLRIRFAVSNRGSIQIGSVGENLHDHLCLLATHQGIANYEDFDGGKLSNRFPDILHDHVVELNEKQNILATWFAELYAKMSEKKVAKYGPVDRKDLYECPLKIHNRFDQEIVVTQGFIHHNQLDFPQIPEHQRIFAEWRNRRWSPIFKNPDQDASLALRTSFEYEEDLVASVLLLQACQDNKNQSKFEAYSKDELPAYVPFVGDPAEKYSSNISVDKQRIIGESSNVALARALIYDQHLSAIHLQADTTWSNVNPSFRYVTLGKPPKSSATYSARVSDEEQIIVHPTEIELEVWTLAGKQKSELGK